MQWKVETSKCESHEVSVFGNDLTAASPSRFHIYQSEDLPKSSGRMVIARSIDRNSPVAAIYKLGKGHVSISLIKDLEMQQGMSVYRKIFDEMKFDMQLKTDSEESEFVDVQVFDIQGQAADTELIAKLDEFKPQNIKFTSGSGSDVADRFDMTKFSKRMHELLASNSIQGQNMLNFANLILYSYITTSTQTILFE